MKKDLLLQFQHIINQASSEDLSIIENWMNGFEKKQTGEFSTYLSAGLQMERTIGDDFCRVSIPITPYIHNTLHIPHGGILAVLLDTAMGVLANHSLSDEFAAVTTNLTMNYLSSVTEGHLHAQATISHKGRKTMVLEGAISDDNGKRLAIGTGSFFIVPRSRK